MKKKAALAAVFAGVLIIMGTAASGLLRWELEWVPENNIETNKFLANSERGFYNMRGVRISDQTPVDENTLESLAGERRSGTLELLQINIGDYRDREISSSGEKQIRDVFNVYAGTDSTVKLIVRPLYDWDGRGAESDPPTIDLVMRHMEQLGEIFADYEDQIYIVQGVFVGSWAEMHSSRYLTPESYQKLIRKMHETMPESVLLAVRTPAYWRMAAGRKQPLSEEEAWDNISLISRLSLFNDGILGTSLDCGTYGDLSKSTSASLQDKWIREDELEFQNELNLYVPNGGEAVLDNELNDLMNADEAFRVMHLSYLNRAHDPEVISKWENTVYQDTGSVYDGMSGYDYIERHLGYRYVIRDVSVREKGWRWQDGQVTVEIENVGYAPRYTPCDVDVIIKNTDSGEVRILPADTDVRQWKPGKVSTVTVDTGRAEDGEYEIWLRVTDEDQEPVLFANENRTADGGSCLLGTIRKGE